MLCRDLGLIGPAHDFLRFQEAAGSNNFLFFKKIQFFSESVFFNFRLSVGGESAAGAGSL